jgi:hypothetical protein
MPQRVTCNDCGHILYQGLDIKPPDEISQMYNGKCPQCGRTLSIIPTTVQVQPYSGEKIEIITVNIPKFEKPGYVFPVNPTLQPSLAQIEANFLATAVNELYEIMKIFDLSEITRDIPKIGGRIISHDRQFMAFRLSLDDDSYVNADHVIELNFVHNSSTYLERKKSDEFLQLKKEDPIYVPIEKRKEYQRILKQKFKKLAKILSENQKQT